MSHPKQWKPNPGPQTEFLASSSYEALYGGAAGGGKSFALLMAPLRWVHIPEFRGLILRRTFPDLEKSIVGKSYELYKSIFGDAADYNQNKHRWIFPSGAEVHLGSLPSDKDVYDYQGSEWQFIGWDELTHFSELQYRYLLSRARSANGIPIRIRATTNPGGTGHEWVFKRWAPWLDPESTVIAHPGETLRYRNDANGDALYCADGRLSRMFIPAKLSDNPYLAESGEYAEMLTAQDAVTRAQLLDGNWLIKPAKGLYFKRGWFDFVSDVPARVDARIRYWDRAASVDGDYTAGVRMSRVGSLFYVEHVHRFRGRPAEVKREILATAETDPEGTIIGIEEDPGQAGVADADDYVRALAGYAVKRYKPTGDKVTRAQPFSAQCEGRKSETGNVVLVRGAWNAPYLDELEQFPEGDHDDQIDGSSGGFNAISKIVTYKSFTSRGSSRA